MFGYNPILTQSQTVAVVDEVCDWESDQGELQPGKRNRSSEQIEEVTQKQKRPISIGQTSILSDNSTQSPSQTFMGFHDKEYCQFLGNSTQTTPKPPVTPVKHKGPPTRLFVPETPENDSEVVKN